MPRSGKKTHTDSQQKLDWQPEAVLANCLLTKQVLLVVAKTVTIQVRTSGQDSSASSIVPAGALLLATVIFLY
jgi:hypothetical protein